MLFSNKAIDKASEVSAMVADCFEHDCLVDWRALLGGMSADELHEVASVLSSEGEDEIAAEIDSLVSILCPADSLARDIAAAKAVIGWDVAND